jgi:hypothetical protein
MAGVCTGFLFYSYTAATIIYLIFGSFAASGNIALLTEHYHANGTGSVLDDIEHVKSRTTTQYFVAAAACLIFSVALYVFCMREGYKPLEEKKITRSISLDMKEPQTNNIINNQNNNIEIPDQKTEEDNKLNTINTVSSTGMGEKDDL